MTLKNKKILYIGSRFFNYENEIQKELRQLGAEVDFFDQRPDNNFITKVMIRLNFKLFIQNRIDKYYKSIERNILNKQYDFIFLISPEGISKKNLENLKKIQPNAKVICYMWDSVKNKLHLLSFFEIIDEVYSFDKNDCISYDFNFLPLFYLDSFKTISTINDAICYDLCFIGTVHSDRYDFIMKIKKQFDKINLKSFMYLYSPSKLMFKIQKLFYKNFNKIKTEDVSFISLTNSQIIDIIAKSRIILDIERPNQNGLSMRTIEILATKRKLITTNKNVKNYDFYNDKNILIVDRINPDVPLSFLDDNYVEYSEDIYNKYSLKNWLGSMFLKNRFNIN